MYSLIELKTLFILDDVVLEVSFPFSRFLNGEDSVKVDFAVQGLDGTKLVWLVISSVIYRYSVNV